MTLPTPVVAYLPTGLLESFRRRLRDTSHLHVAASLQELNSLSIVYPNAVRVVAGHGTDTNETEQLCRVLGRGSMASVVVYLRLSPQAVHTATELCRRGVRRVVIEGFDDVLSDRFQEILEGAKSDVLATEFLHAASPFLEVLPGLTRTAFQRLFFDPIGVPDGDRLAFVAGMPRRTLNWTLARAHLAPSAELVRLARALHVYHHVRQHHTLLKAVAGALNYPNERSLRAEFQRITGHSPSTVERQMSHQQIMARFVCVLRNGRDDHPSWAPLDTGLSDQGPDMVWPRLAIA